MRSYIKVISSYLPEKVLTNSEIELLHPDWNFSELTKITGVLQRHVSAENEIPSDMAMKCCESLFSEKNIKPEEIDFIIYCSIYPDFIIPPTSTVLQSRLNLSKNCGTIDINKGCTGFMHGLMLAKGLIESETAKNVLLINTDTLTKFLHPDDKSNWSLFGDGAAATVISACETDNESNIGKFVFGTDGSGFSNIIIKNGGAKFPDRSLAQDIVDQYGNIRNDNFVYMNNTPVFLFFAKVIPKVVNELLAKHEIALNDIDVFVFHQASSYIVDSITKKLQIPEEKRFMMNDRVGNTVSAAMPIALDYAVREQRIKKGDKVMLVSFGVGYAWSSTIITY